MKNALPSSSLSQRGIALQHSAQFSVSVPRRAHSRELPSIRLSAITPAVSSIEVLIRRVIGTSFTRNAKLTLQQKIGIVTA
jgi:hypothetical protein